MKILYDHQIFTNQQYGGISRYFFELIKRFDNNENSCEVATIFSNNAYYNKDFNSEIKNFLPNINIRGKGRVTRLFNQQFSASKIDKGNYDILHPTYYDDYFIDKIKSKPFVVTFYDMIHEKLSNKFIDLKLDSKTFDFKKKLLEHSAKVIAISETTKNDII